MVETFVRLRRPEPADSDSPRVELTTLDPLSSGLECETKLGSGVSVTVDVVRPSGWRSVSITAWSPDTSVLLGALIGDAATAWLHARLRPDEPGRQPSLGQRDRQAVDPDSDVVSIDVSRAEPWLRVAATEALNQRLHLPLDQTLLDAERAVARGRAALTLDPAARLRAELLAEALLLSRGAAAGLAGYLTSLAAGPVEVPRGLHSALAHLVDGYVSLRDQVQGPDHQLQGVLDCWKRLSTSESKRPTTNTYDGSEPDDSVDLERRPGAGSLLDPRQVPARLLRLSADTRHAEVSLSRVDLRGREAVLVQVPAYDEQLDEARTDHLLVRLVERSSGQLRSHALLTLHRKPARTRAGHGRAVFESTLPLGGGGLDDIRADVYDLASTVPPASTDTDVALREARQATVFIREWRRLTAAVRLPTEPVRPASQVRRLARSLRSPESSTAETSERPLFHGGPSLADLERWAELGDSYLLRGLRDDAVDRAVSVELDPDASATFNLTRGPGALLAAELAAAFVST